MPGSAHIFGRDAELQRLRQMLDTRRSFLLHGPAGVGKTLLARRLTSERPNILYSPQSSTSHGTFRALATELVRSGSKQVMNGLGGSTSALERIRHTSAVSLRGMVAEALRHAAYWVVLDGLRCPSQPFAAGIKELALRVPLLAIARSTHMEDIGFLRPLFADRLERYALRNFEPEVALAFAQHLSIEMGLTAGNLNDVVGRIVKYSDGNPGAIVAMLQMAASQKYRLNGQVAMSPLYRDFQLGRVSTNG